MSVDQKRLGTVEVFAPHGPLVDEDVEELMNLIRSCLGSSNPRFILDMTDVPYLDSKGIEGLVEAANSLQVHGGRLCLASVGGTCREVLELTGQSERVEFFDNATTAVRSFL